MPSAIATAPVRPRRVGRRLLAAVPLALLLTACGAADPGSSSAPAADGYGGSSADQGSATPPADGTSNDTTDGAVTYRVAQYTFPELTVAPGTSVRVVNEDDEPHTVTAEDGSFDTGAFDSDDAGMFTAPPRPGTYRITCTVHPSMHGEIVVR
jgi:plastocyanin